jgi:hypothetical protein
VRRRVRRLAVLMTIVAVLMAGAAPAAFGYPGKSGDANCTNQQTAWPTLPATAHNAQPAAQGNEIGGDNFVNATNAAWHRC